MMKQVQPITPLSVKKILRTALLPVKLMLIYFCHGTEDVGYVKDRLQLTLSYK